MAHSLMFEVCDAEAQMQHTLVGTMHRTRISWKQRHLHEVFAYKLLTMFRWQMIDESKSYLKTCKYWSLFFFLTKALQRCLDVIQVHFIP